MNNGSSQFSPEDLQRYREASNALESTRSQVEALEQTSAVGTFNRQLDLLRRRLLNDPQAFRDMFISDGTAAIVAEFQQEELSPEFIRTFWELLLRDDDMSKILMRFVWGVPLGLKRKFVRALDKHLSDRYPMFKGLSRNWPAESFIPPYIRSPEERSVDFGLVNQGYLGYMNLGYTAREVDMIVWLEVLRDKQCDEKPCEIGVHVPGKFEPKGGCPVKIHIPQVLDLLGNGRFREAMELIENCNPLPNVTGRVCPQELQCQGVCAHTKQPIEIGQLEWFLPQREKVVNPDGIAARFAGFPDPWEKAEKPPIAVVGSGPAGLINAYLLAVEGFPVTVFEAFHALGGVLRYGIPEFRLPNELIDDVVGKIKLLGGKFVSNFVVGKTATLQDLRNAGFWKIFVGTGAGLPRFMNVPGEHLLNVMSANEFLTRVNLMQGLREDFETPLPETAGKQVLIIGGGNTAMDAARAAKRIPGVENVRLVYRRTKRYMPADEEELALALEDGVEFMELLAPVGVKDGTLTCKVMELGAPDASGRRSPVDTGKTVGVPAATVITAVGELVDSELYKANGMALDKRGKAVVNESMESSVKNLYVVGDARRGPATVVEAIADATAAAMAIAGFDPEVDVEKNISAEYDKAKAKHGDLVLDVDPSHDKRCLACPTVCEACVEVCPNRANIAVSVPGKRQRQIVHVDGMCNECGNCGTFCPYDGLPYKDKFTLFWSEEDFSDSTNAGWLPKENGLCLVRLGGTVQEYNVDDASCGLYEELRQLILAVHSSYSYLVK